MDTYRERSRSRTPTASTCRCSSCTATRIRSCRCRRRWRSSSACATAGGDVELVVMEGEGHGFRQPAQPARRLRAHGRLPRAPGSRTTRASVTPMPIVSRGGEEDEQRVDGRRPARRRGSTSTSIPYDPDQVKVHYNLTGWSFEQRAELAETLAERGVPHTWEGDELVVPEQIESRRRRAVRRARDARSVRSPCRCSTTRAKTAKASPSSTSPSGRRPTSTCCSSRCSRARSRTGGQGRTLVVSHDAEHAVDDLLDAIESGDAASLDEGAEAPDGALNSLYVAADRLSPATGSDGAARSSLLALVPSCRRRPRRSVSPRGRGR